MSLFSTHNKPGSSLFVKVTHIARLQLLFRQALGLDHSSIIPGYEGRKMSSVSILIHLCESSECAWSSGHYKVTVNCNFTIPISMSRDYSICPRRLPLILSINLAGVQQKVPGSMCANRIQIRLRNRVVWLVFVVCFWGCQGSNISSGGGGGGWGG